MKYSIVFVIQYQSLKKGKKRLGIVVITFAALLTVTNYLYVMQKFRSDYASKFFRTTILD